MKQRKLVQVKEANEELSEEWDGWTIYYENEWTPNHLGRDDEIRRHPQLTLEQIAEFCDQEAESKNNQHSFVGTHRILANFLLERIGREQATRLLSDIATYGGLGTMSLEEEDS